MSTIRTITILVALGAIAAFAAIASRPATPEPPAQAAAPMQPADDALCISNKIAAAIFAEGTDPSVIAKVYEMILEPLEEQNSRYFTGSRWPVGSSGTPVEITYSFPADGIQMDAGPANVNVLNADLNGIFGNETVWKDLIRQVFDEWENHTGNIYTEVSDDNAGWGASGPIHGGSNRGDIRIWSRFIDGGSGTLAFNFFPGSGVGGDMVLDSNENWGSGSSINYRFFRNVVSHENGHGMGLAHVCTDSSNLMLMNPFATTFFDGPQHDDIRGMQRLYGDPDEPNNSSGEAADLGSFNPGDSANIFGASVWGSDDDYFAVTVTGSALLSVEVNPTGFTYPMAPQNSNGSCPTGTPFESLSQHDLRLRVFSPGGVELTEVNDEPVGFSEEFTDLSLAGGGTYYVVVDSVDTFNFQTQLYNLSVEIGQPLPTGDINGDCIVDTADLGGLIGSFGSAGPFADINGDGIVDTADLGALIGNFGATCDDL